MSAQFDAGRFGSGKAVRRVEDAALLAGRGEFAGDLTRAGQTHIAFVRSPHAHARIASVDVSGATAVPGVLAVYTGAELAQAGVKPIPTVQGFKRADGSDGAGPPQRALAHEFVRFVGEPVAAVVAETREAARDAAEAVFVDYEDLPAVVDPVRAIAAGAPVVWPQAPDNVAAEMHHGDPAATQQAFARAAHTVSLDVVNQRVAPTPLEPRSVLAWVDPADSRLTLRMSSQMPTGVLGSLCDAIPGLRKDQVRVTVGDVGGGFGMKTGIFPEDIVIAWAARALKRPVKWQADRVDEFTAAYHGRDTVSRAELALDAAGKVLALRVRTLGNVGAYGTNAGVAIQLLVGPWVSTSIYDIRTIDLQFKAVLTHTAPTSAYRGAGRPEAIYLIERLFDAAAREMQVDPAQLRRRNMIRPEQMPYTSAMAQVYDSGRFEQILDRGLALADWNGFAARRELSQAQGRLRGRGIASFLEWTGGNALEEKVGVNVRADGTIEIHSATQAMGQGIATSYAQLAVDVFGVPIERIRILQGDTDRANGFGSAGSRSLFTGGSAVKVASERTVDHAKGLAADALEASAGDIEYAAGRFRVAGTDVGIDLFELAARQPGERIFIDAKTAAGGPTWPNACHVCEVEIDPDTGTVEIVRYSSVNDIGRVVNPVIARGQVEGGAVQGIGQALCERVVYDAESGQMLTGSLMDYAVPRADVSCMFETEFDTSVPCLTNPLGVKGVGELGTIGATPCVVNAVIDALDHVGLGRDAERIQMPLTADRVWAALRRDLPASPFA
ncbi:MAG TPA: xanthine dehydrogenase family protein molybdopterin-binding subunit [Albitalea sp.]|uniref:xanthine dehydrogenase family protein molybdopterin-binding subunit n=1 Tax=Piscinibacter sp. TaxID=1903157 RepID=UPI002ED019E2